MRLIVQRAERASCTVDGNVTGSIGKGFMVLLGVGPDDTEKECERLSKKLVNLRIFPDENGKTNRSLADVGGQLLIVSQFTLYADCSGNRPYMGGGKPAHEAEQLYELFVKLCREKMAAPEDVQTGIFGAEMKIELINDGPFTIILE